MNKIKQVYHPYWLWEDFKNGMWNDISREEESKLLKIAIEFTGDHIKYGKSMMKVIEAWPITCEHNFTNSSINHQAHIGNCAVCLELGIPEHVTRRAWKYLTDEQRKLANGQADLALEAWEIMYLNKTGWLFNGISR